MKYASDDPYSNPKTGVLKNKLGITDQEVLDRYESTFVYARSIELSQDPIKGSFDLDHLKAIHKRLFCDVYEWAGEIRTVDISKGTSRFASTGLIESYAPKISASLQKENCLRDLEPGKFSERMAYYMGEFNVLHPFREGNGRSLREFMSQVANEAGYEVDWTQITQEEITKASINAYHGDHGYLTDLIRKNLHDLDREKALEIAHHTLGKDVKLERAKDGLSYKGRIIGNTERYIVQAKKDSPNEVVLHQRSKVGLDPKLFAKKQVGINYTDDGKCTVSSHKIMKGKRM